MGNTKGTTSGVGITLSFKAYSMMVCVVSFLVFSVCEVCLSMYHDGVVSNKYIYFDHVLVPFNFSHLKQRIASILIYFVLCYSIIKSKSCTQRWWTLSILCFWVLLLLMAIGVGPCDNPTQNVPRWCIATSLNGHCQVIIWKGWPRTIVSAVFWGLDVAHVLRFAR